MEGVFQASYSPLNSLDMLIKYSYKNKAKNYQDTEESKLVLPNIRQRLHYQLTYSPLSFLRWKTVCGNMCVRMCGNGRLLTVGHWVVV